MNPVAIKAAIVAVIATAAFVAGWRVSSAFDAETRERELIVAKQIMDEARQREANRAAVLEKRLVQLSRTRKEIERETIKIVERPVYRSICLDDSGLRLIEHARAGEAPASESPATMPAPDAPRGQDGS